MSAPQPVNLGTERRPFLVEFAVNPTFDLMISTWSSVAPDLRDKVSELGASWLEDFSGSIPSDALSELEVLSGGSTDLMLWLTLGVVAAEAPELETIDETLDWIATRQIRRDITEQLCIEAPVDAIADALAGDGDAIDTVVELHGESKHEAISDFLRARADDFSQRLAAALGSIRRTAFADLEVPWAEAIERSAAAIALTVPGSQPQELIDRITHGIDFRMPLGVTRLVLIPSVFIRPWSMVQEFGTAVIVAYPISEEHLDADPDAAPSWLVSFHKALGDARRLKILRRLAAGPADLGELTELLGMPKSSTFHHIGVLRSAGLVSVHVGGPDAGTYDLRTRAFADAEGLLDKYLEIPLIQEDSR